MRDINLDIVDKYYLIREVEEQIIGLLDKKRGPSNNNQIDIQVEMWKKLLNILVSYDDHSNKKHRYVFDVNSIGEVNDGSHSFDELYWHRMMLFAVICNSHKDKAWKSRLHHDGTMYDDYFIVGIETPEGQYTYHYHIDWWDKFDVQQRLRAPEYDGHTPEDIIRLFSLIEDKKEEDE
jgi:hypothetical protein